MKRLIRKAWLVADGYLEHHLLSSRTLKAHLFFWTRLVLAWRRPFIIGVTGSVGKTTTAEMVAAVVEHPEARRLVGPVGKTVGNMNNHDGLPLTVLGYDRWYKSRGERVKLLLWLPFRALSLLWSAKFPRLFVLEYGTDRTGYLRPLADLARPNIGIVTAVGPAHLEGMGTLEGVAREKSTLAGAVGPDGLVILGEGHDYVDWIAGQCRARVVRCSGRGVELARNIARRAGEHLGIPGGVIEAALAARRPPEHRLNRLELRGRTVIDDSYNANPLSMGLGLDTLAEIAAPEGRRRVAALGMMGELGPRSRTYHEEVGKLARARADLVIGVGEMARHYAPDHWFPDSETCAGAIESLTRPGDVVLVKGSASVAMVKIVERLRQPPEAASG